MNVISVPPHAPVLMEATRAIGYSIETALADIIDNSIAAKATRIDINFFPIDIPFISVLDNGIGMDESELIHAMRYGSRNPLEERAESDLGRFGLGLKTASMSQCRKLTVICKKGPEIIGAQWDLDFIANTGDWSLRILDSNDINEYPQAEQLRSYDSGTLVVWQVLDRLNVGELNFVENMGKRMDRVREHLSLVFHRYLAGESGRKRISININNLLIEPLDPFLTGKSTQVMDDESINITGQKIIVRAYVLPHISMLSETEIKSLGGKDGLRKNQGFYIYRNKRLLAWGTWFRMMRKGDLSKLARVRVDIPNSLDYLWTLDIKKSMAIPPEVVRKNLAVIINRIADSSKRTWTYRGKKETDESSIHVWNRIKTRDGGIVYEINRDYPLIESVVEAENVGKQALEQLLVQIERQLPLNQLYIDLTSDERIVNENDMQKADVLPIFKQLLAGCKNTKEIQEMAERLSRTEPFDQHPEWLTELTEELK